MAKSKWLVTDLDNQLIMSPLPEFINGPGWKQIWALASPVTSQEEWDKLAYPMFPPPFFAAWRLGGHASPIVDCWKKGRSDSIFVGTLRYFKSKHTALIDMMSVRASYRRQGINSALLNSLLDHEKDVKKIIFFQPTDDGKRFIRGCHPKREVEIASSESLEQVKKLFV